MPSMKRKLGTQNRSIAAIFGRALCNAGAAFGLNQNIAGGRVGLRVGW